jgi:hypothetical protein
MFKLILLLTMGASPLHATGDTSYGTLSECEAIAAKIEDYDIRVTAVCVKGNK